MTRVVLLVASWCPVCPEAKTLWRRLRSDCDFGYEEVDIESARGKALVTEHEIRGVPTTLIDGQVAFVGVPEPERASKAAACAPPRATSRRGRAR